LVVQYFGDFRNVAFILPIRALAVVGPAGLIEIK
jgi:hypothetical protein